MIFITMMPVFIYIQNGTILTFVDMDLNDPISKKDLVTLNLPVRAHKKKMKDHQFHFGINTGVLVSLPMLNEIDHLFEVLSYFITREGTLKKKELLGNQYILIAIVENETKNDMDDDIDLKYLCGVTTVIEKSQRNRSHEVTNGVYTTIYCQEDIAMLYELYDPQETEYNRLHQSSAQHDLTLTPMESPFITMYFLLSKMKMMSLLRYASSNYFANFCTDLW